MNAINYSIRHILKKDIPRAILNMTFLSRQMYDTFTFDTLESKIREEVFEGFVAMDCNLVNATQMTIPLAMCERIDGSFYTATYRIPKTLTQGKKVLYPIHITQAAGTMTAVDTNGVNNIATSTITSSFSFNGVGGVFSAVQQAAESVSPIPLISQALVYMVGENTVLIKDSIIAPGNMQLRVVVENDENMDHIQPPYYPVFHDLFLLAVKSYIYNNLVIEQDNAFINSGGELNRFKDIVESYSDAAEQYKVQLEFFQRSMMLNDPEGWRRHYQARVGGGY